ncbi:EF-hand calcium-binding domain-containing protein 7 [Ditylenchus destructor]|uniref:EF-hand calcium-binding domain-containing protein 7 n=1 Tax=Ditylenchus destructor TaxID=166010 RepID=A0AAD4MSS3_9BILA|nr:EF-hand calcium-binding domain-containing protein 7 [Ditylenchus destructor]
MPGAANNFSKVQHFDASSSESDEDDVDDGPLGPESEISVRLAEEDDRKAFQDAFITEIGERDFSRKITFRELLDVIVCAGKDVRSDDLKGLWTYGTEKEEISFEEAFHIFQQAPSTDFDSLYSAWNAFSDDVGLIDYDRIIYYIREQATDQDRNEVKAVLKWLKEQKRYHIDLDTMIYDMHNAQRFKRKNRRGPNPRRKTSSIESQQSLSSMFSNRNHNPLNNLDQNQGTASIVSSFREPLGDKGVTVKSMVIQKSSTQSTCISYSFTLDKPQRMRINIHINEQIDSSLNRFQNLVLGILQGQDKVYAVTKRKDNGAVCTEWVKLPAGLYKLRVKFCRPLKMVEPEKSDEILDAKRRLTKSFKVMLMNLFDMFDLDNDGQLSRDEFEAYSILSGSGPVKDEKWELIRQNFKLQKPDYLSMKTFIEMHQIEAESYGPKGLLRDMWAAVRELGHNTKFFMSTACPILAELLFSEHQCPLAHFEIDQSKTNFEDFLVEYLWENGTPLPYLKEIFSLRQFKTDYYAILIAGRTDKEMQYKLDLSMSNNVNIEGHDLLIDQTVPPNTAKVLTVAMAQADSWYLSVKKHSNDGSSQHLPASAK